MVPNLKAKMGKVVAFIGWYFDLSVYLRFFFKLTHFLHPKKTDQINLQAQ